MLVKDKYRSYNNLYLRDLNLIPLAQLTLIANVQGIENVKLTCYLATTPLWTFSYCSGSLSVLYLKFRSLRETPAMFTPLHTGIKKQKIHLLHSLNLSKTVMIALSGFQLGMLNKTNNKFRCLSLTPNQLN